MFLHLKFQSQYIQSFNRRSLGNRRSLCACHSHIELRFKLNSCRLILFSDPCSISTHILQSSLSRLSLLQLTIVYFTEIAAIYSFERRLFLNSACKFPCLLFSSFHWSTGHVEASVYIFCFSMIVITCFFCVNFSPWSWLDLVGHFLSVGILLMYWCRLLYCLKTTEFGGELKHLSVSQVNSAVFQSSLLDCGSDPGVSFATVMLAAQ